MALVIVIKSANIYNNECVVSLTAKNNQFCFLLKYISDRPFTFFIFTRVKELNLYQSSIGTLLACQSNICSRAEEHSFQSPVVFPLQSGNPECNSLHTSACVSDRRTNRDAA